MKHLVNCHSPKWVYNRYTHEKLLSNCGHCPACLNAKHLRHVDLMTKQQKLSKYAYFCTLTYDDLSVPKLYFSKEHDALYNKSDHVFVDIPKDLDPPTADWLSKKSYVEYVRYKDFQDFMKRFRQQYKRKMPFSEALNQFKKYGNYEQISYYCASEYGSYTARPHMHLLLFFNSDWLANNFGSLFYSCWSEFDRITRRRHCKGVRSQFRPSSGNDFGYTASYVDSSSDLPSIFQDKVLRPRCSYSKKPLLGSPQPSREEISQFVYSGALRQYDGLDRNGEAVPVYRSNSFENRFFPKCPSFASISDRGRMFAYRLPFLVSYYVGGSFSYNDFRDYLLDPVNLSHISGLISFEDSSLRSCLARQVDTVRPFYGFWVSSLRFWSVCHYLDLSPGYYLKLISDYYSLKSYYRLTDYYSFLSDYSKKDDIRFALSLCDNMSHVKIVSLPFTESSDFKSMVVDSSSINERGKKSKKDRDYQLRGNAVVFNP